MSHARNRFNTPRLRIEMCPLGDQKPACRRCTIQCHDPGHRNRIRAVMRYAGPRMLFRYPLLALRHMLRWLLRPHR
ncbi:nitrous oxide-stimulated promoter family protein [Candidatus Bipolaricaulota bacterium]|nr:nitrous oxide-stimulated promoter family protein [Candidatus Bipolaricaulota bacterium]